MKKTLIFFACLLAVVLVAQQAVQNGNTLAGLYGQSPTVQGVKDPATLSGSSLQWLYSWQQNTNPFTSGQSMDVTLPVQFINAGAAVTVAGFKNVEYNHYYKDVTLIVSNNTAGAFSVTLPNGVAILTNAVTTANSIPGGKRAKFIFDIYPHSTSGFTDVVIFVQSN